MNLNHTKFGELEAFNVIIEIPQGSNQKFEIDEATGEMKVNFVFKNLVFPFNYGFIPQTLGGDGDTLDAIVISSKVIPSASVVQCKTIGILKTIDRGEVDDKVICVPLNDPLAKKYNDITDLPTDSFEKWKELYLEIGRQKNKHIEITTLANKEEALKEIKNSLK
ncbi:MAG TPA: inorganic diphosphatase [Candidatus Limnocylindria bacterium]|nr:inorganic diphosphatase [Candidatus Limnocylindria bacterium]